MILIGSAALAYHCPKFNRKIIDADYIATYNEFNSRIKWFKDLGLLKQVYPTSGTSFVVKLYDNSSLSEIQEYNIAYSDRTDRIILDLCEGLDVAPLPVLLMLKLSHRYKKNSPHFLKTMRDIQFLRSQGVVLNDKLKELLTLREKETYTYKHPNLNQNKDNFFVKTEDFYVWDHDDIHRAVATLDKPAYLYFKPQDSEVMVSKKMWDACPLDVQLRAGLEESYVLAIERSLVPSPGVLTPKQAFDKALEKVCTSITSGWFREFCWEHYDDIQALYDDNFFTKFQEAAESGKVKPFNP